MLPKQLLPETVNQKIDKSKVSILPLIIFCNWLFSSITSTKLQYGKSEAVNQRDELLSKFLCSTYFNFPSIFFSGNPVRFEDSAFHFCRGHLLGQSFVPSSSARGSLQDEDHSRTNSNSFPGFRHMRSGRSPERFWSDPELTGSWKCRQDGITRPIYGFQSYKTPGTTSLWLSS